ncbi:Uncharacterised protein [Neisseria subflava]|uniref:Uncharacterized protein n=1 Tax=Neisseria subflava TaxID=28449 RepID=A0A9X9QXA4_NEISU|nr:hypothetical protein [Neisseria subflava]VTY02041.1 Uncharacterised protein [Neisseria subflava]
MNTKNILVDASNCVYTSADLTISTGYQINDSNMRINVSFIKRVPTPILSSDGQGYGEMKPMRVANIDLDIQAAKILIDTLSILISDAEK